MLLEYIKKHYEENEPIFISDLCEFNSNMNVVRKTVKKLTTAGTLKRYDTGVYFMPSDVDAELDIQKVVERKYLSNKEGVFGYVFGGKLAQELGELYKFPSGYERDTFDVVSNKATTEYRELKIAGCNVILRQPRVEINEENCKVLQFLDFIKDLVISAYREPKKYETVMLNEIGASFKFERDAQSIKLANYMIREGITLELVNKYLEYYHSKVAKNLYLLGFLQIPTQKDFEEKYKYKYLHDK